MRKTRIDGFELKEATKDDAKLIMYFIKEMAKYEKMEDEVTGSIEDLQKNIWDNNYADILLAYCDGEAIGYALFFTNFSTFTCKGVMYLEDVFIAEEYRNRGFGKEIFYQLACIATERDCNRFEWVCLDWNEPSIRFYEDVIGAKAHKEWLRFRLDEMGIKNLVEKK
ncbi:GNAT superfamily N-acetyltransferase [Bacilli bacterium PM5-3]|nr:GNAT superfamily N-acetyltransferase [Bacilli bacterium PM5-3]MDH6604005.1 GNAT superfamily N-acetyltransferase [Bacilli bacterium PM5-9]